MLRELINSDSSEEDNDDGHHMPKRMKASADSVPSFRCHNYDDDDEDNGCIATSYNPELQRNGWEVTVTSAETDVHSGTLLRNHLYTVDNPYTNEIIYTDVAKVTFDARPNSLDAVNFTRRFHEGRGVKTFHEIADDMAHVAFDAHQNSHEAVSLLDSGASKCMFKNRSMFDYLKRTNYGISTASTNLTVKEAGPVKCIKEAYYLPTATHDLISIGDLDNLGCRIVIEKGVLAITRNSKPVIEVVKSNNVWSAVTAEVLDGILMTMSPEEKKEMWWLPSA